ncbi:MAG: hypothetical protein OXI25_03470 [Chloroflexota bacterium]|nr:hypothetical protein [Chloroflexota bacterium]
MAQRSIVDIEAAADALPPDARARFDRIYRAAVYETELRAPAEMVPWIERTFGSLAAVRRQRIVRVDNLVTGEGALFNSLRALRPVQAAPDGAGADDVARALEDDPWADPYTATPEDAFGRLQSAHGVTAANVARYDGAHSLVIFNEADPLAFDDAALAAHLELAQRWFERVWQEDPSACYPFLMWNCLWRAGGSIVHGHMQAAVARGGHYAKIERLRADAERYRAAHGASYFDDLFDVHRALGLRFAGADGLEGAAHLTPLKEKELIFRLPVPFAAAAAPLSRALRRYVDALGARSFNLALLLPPLAPAPEAWDGFPPLARLVDRGPLGSRTSDIGGMELYAQSVAASDPFAVAAEMARAFA